MRPKEFERDIVIKKAIKIFTDHGFEGTSTEALTQAMGISRQSMYDTFGDKQNLYLEALQHYTSHRVSEIIRVLSSANSPLNGIEEILLALTHRNEDFPMGCLGVAAVSEFGRANHGVCAVTDSSHKIITSAIEGALTKAKERGEADSDLNIKSAAQFIMATMSGMKVSARGGASVDVLRNIANMALRGLK